MLVGHAGVQAVDDETNIALVRLISPGAEVAERGTIRILVKNLGTAPFEFGPDQVKLTLADGTILIPSSVEQFEKGRSLVEHENRIAGATDLTNRNNLSGLEQQSRGSGPASSLAAQSGGAASAARSSSATLSQEHRSDALLLPGGRTLDAIYQILIAQPVEPNQAWGGYYVFDMPKKVFARRADQPLSISVKTGAEEHRFDAILKWK
jgi:hypothetical protein